MIEEEEGVVECDVRALRDKEGWTEVQGSPKLKKYRRRRILKKCRLSSNMLQLIGDLEDGKVDLEFKT